jgi:malate dehydrogenase (oxaloacetate-decarboxylating)
MTNRANTVAVISDGSEVLGLGNIGPEGAIPICLATQDTQAIIDTVRYLAPSFGGINLEDISAPRCFEIEDALQDLGIPGLPRRPARHRRGGPGGAHERPEGR